MKVEVKVVIGSGKPEFKDGILIIHTTEKLEKGLANRDIIQQVAKYYKVPSTEVRITNGLRSRKKVLEITRLEKEGSE